MFHDFFGAAEEPPYLLLVAFGQLDVDLCASPPNFSLVPSCALYSDLLQVASPTSSTVPFPVNLLSTSQETAITPQLDAMHERSRRFLMRLATDRKARSSGWALIQFCYRNLSQIPAQEECRSIGYPVVLKSWMA